MLDMSPDFDVVVEKAAVKPRSVVSEEDAKLLRRAYQLIEKKSCWTRRAEARALWDLPVSPESRLARKFCAYGALQRAAKDLGSPRGSVSRLEALLSTGDLPLTALNDGHGHRAVLDRFERVIAIT